MGIQPIDLQTMYSQLSNISQNVSAQQSANQMSQAVSMENQKNQNLENSKKVQSAAASTNENTNSNTVNADGRNGNNNQGFQQNKKNNGYYSPQDIQPDNKISADDSSCVGRIVDITR